MPVLSIKESGRQIRNVPLHQKLMSMGRSAECDIVLNDSVAAPDHCQLHCDGQLFHISALGKEAKFSVNDRAKKHHTLKHRDVIRIGNTEITFLLYGYEEPSADLKPSDVDPSHASFRSLFEFSNQLLSVYELDALLNKLMDAVIDVTRADKGFLILFEDGEPKIKVARNIQRESIDNAIGQLSDSIVSKVVETKKPLIVSDALKDDEFSNAQSVIHLRLL